jgi:hypothetical protein
MQVVLIKQEKEKLVIRLHKEGKTIREIAHIVHLSFTDIGKIIRWINVLKDETVDLKNKSKDTQALYLFSIGKLPLGETLDLDLSAYQLHDLQEEFWTLNQLHELVFAYGEIKNLLPSFMKLYHCLEEFNMLNEEYLISFLNYAGLDLPELTNRIQ